MKEAIHHLDNLFKGGSLLESVLRMPRFVWKILGDEEVRMYIRLFFLFSYFLEV